MATSPKSAAALATKPKSLDGSVPAAQAKTHLLRLLDTVHRERRSITITKRGKPVAQLVPLQTEPRASLWGCMKGSGRITGDIVGPEPDLWEAMTE